jgi:DNA-binding transcriptional regulator YdaS (Cro superfamily)
MTLDAYLHADGSKSLTALSVEVGISKSRLSQLRENINWPPELALKVEHATGGAVDASAISPVVATARSSGPRFGRAA